MMPVFAQTGIETRHSCRPYAWFRDEKGWPQRMEAFTDGATALFRDAAAEALEAAGIAAGDIASIVTVSSTGIATPTIEALAMHEMGFRDDTRRRPVFGLGCAGGVTGLALASDLVSRGPVLLVVAELCTLAFRPDEMSKSNLVATALFGDGAAACVLTDDDDGALGEIEHSGEHCWPGTRDIMGWRIDAEGFGAIFSRSIPDFVTQNMKGAAEAFLARAGLTRADIGQFVFHPGGAKVIVALERAFGLEQGELQNERKVLAENGNMSAPTVLFVLAEALRTPWHGRRLLSALGPGFTASFLTMLS
jgi:alkylresorcinol/alkylpyrone synthase